MSDKINFEQTLSELEQVVARLESGECTLDESIELFTKGVELTKKCNSCLENAKLQIKLLNESEAL
ncbi:MAG: exodeoxyribonuclease VII small subunit [Clostridia bacterium]|nr:exodeoxyribonuclease VII small subunit [Clostridia bacterium]